MNEVRLIPFRINEIQASFTQSGADAIKAPLLWPKTKGKGVVVAVIDTGIDIDHPDLKANIIGGYNFTWDYTRDTLNFDDNNDHGTHVAGIIKSVAPEVKLLAIKVMDSQGRGLLPWVWQAIDYAINWRGPGGEKVSVMNMSLETSVDEPELHRVIQEATKAGISVVCAAGNSGDDNADTHEKAYPGYYQEVIEVAACNNEGLPAYFSNTNDEIDCIAPGVQIRSCWLGRGYVSLSGTSMAAPHVAGTLALLRSLHPDYTEMELYEKLIECTRDMGYPKMMQGCGIVDLSLYKEDKKEDEDTMRGIILMYSMADLGAALRLHNKYKYPIIEMAFASEDEKNAKVKLQVGGVEKFTPDTVLIAGVDRYQTDIAVTEYINTH